MNKFIKSLAFLFIAIFGINAANAQNPHIQGPLYYTDLGKVLQVCYDIAGLGNVSQTKLTITYTATVTTQCVNRGGNIAPGQTKTYTNVGEAFVVPVNNGRAKGCTITKKILPAGPCPNGFRDGKVVDVTFSNVSITVGGKTFPVTTVQ